MITSRYPSFDLYYWNRCAISTDFTIARFVIRNHYQRPEFNPYLLKIRNYKFSNPILEHLEGDKSSKLTETPFQASKRLENAQNQLCSSENCPNRPIFVKVPYGSTSAQSKSPTSLIKVYFLLKLFGTKTMY